MPSICCQLSFLERRRTTSAFFKYWESIPWEPHLRKNVRRQSRGHIWPSYLVQTRKRHIPNIIYIYVCVCVFRIVSLSGVCVCVFRIVSLSGVICFKKNLWILVRIGTRLLSRSWWDQCSDQQAPSLCCQLLSSRSTFHHQEAVHQNLQLWVQ